MSTVIHIEKVETLIIGQQHAAGADPAELAAIGYAEAAGLPESPVIDGGPQSPKEEKEVLKNKADERAATSEPIPDHVNPHTRQQLLLGAIERLGRGRRLVGALKATEFPLDDHDSAVDANEGYWDAFERLARQACTHCMYSGDCRLEGKPKRLAERHPSRAQATRKDQEPLEDFKERLLDDTLAHCVPPGSPRKPKRTSPV